MEEDAEDASNGSADVWDESLEAPFWFLIWYAIMDLLKLKVKFSP